MSAVEWLLSSEEPAIRYLTRRDVLGEDVEADPGEILGGPKVTALLSGQQHGGGFGPGTPYRKWTGAHWRLVSLVELTVPETDPRVAAAAEHELAWIVRQGPYRNGPSEVGGLPRVCASIGGNALAVSSRLGLAGDPRARTVAERLISWQWPDGGWNCDVKASGYRSSFHETLSTAWGLYEYAKATGSRAAEAAGDRAVELFLEHRLLYRLGTDEVINRHWLELRYPSYWRYDLLRALRLLTRMGKVDDPRTQAALDELERRRRPDGRWAADDRWWNPGAAKITPEAVDWGAPGQPNELITLDALRVLRAAGRLGAGRQPEDRRTGK